MLDGAVLPVTLVTFYLASASGLLVFLSFVLSVVGLNSCYFRYPFLVSSRTLSMSCSNNTFFSPVCTDNSAMIW
jgi:hypothetical protein